MKSAIVFFAALALVHCNSLKSANVIKPRHEVTKDWYETAIFYQIYPRSFMDSDGDGVGDLPGIISKLQHLKDSGITATWLSPIFKSPMKDFGYDVSDFRNVDEIFGTNEDLRRLFEEADKLGIKIILDFVPNHTSDEHEWFQKSVARDPQYADYYVWRDCPLNGTGDGRILPNNWVSVFYGPAWTYHPERGQCYLHQFVKEQPDLNFRNPAVVQEMKDVLTYWLDQGAAGFRIDAINHLIEHASFADEDVTEGATNPNDYGYTIKHFTKDQPETYGVVYEWRDLLDAYVPPNNDPSNQYTRIIMTEAYASLEDTMRYYGNGTHLGSHMPFNFILINNLWSGTGTGDGSTASDFKREIDTLLAALPEGKSTNWVMGNHDQSRVGSRYGYEKIDGLLGLVMTLPGIAVTYNGEEIGMVDWREISYEDSVDPQGCNLGPEGYKERSRDPVRTPFQWDATRYAGFSKGTTDPWLPVHPNYVTLNLAAQVAAQRSTYKFYLQLSELRKSHTLMEGSYESIVVDQDIFILMRHLDDDHPTYVTVINFASVEKTVNLKSWKPNTWDYVIAVAAGALSCKDVGDVFNAEEIYLRPYDAAVFEYIESSAGKAVISLFLTLIAFMWTRLFN